MTVPEAACSGREEELAAFIDDGLTEDERHELIEHMANCDACYEIFCETSQLLDGGELGDDEAEDVEGVVVAMPSPEESVESPASEVTRPRTGWRRAAWAAPLAAAAMLAVMVGRAFLFPVDYTVEDVVVADGYGLRETSEPVPEEVKRFWNVLEGDSRFQTYRSAGSVLDEGTITFRIGVRTADLDVALQANAREIARDFAADLAHLVEEDFVLGALDDLSDGYLEIYDRLADDEDDLPEMLLADARALRETIDGFLGVDEGDAVEPRYILGKWSGGALLAAALEDRTFFENRRQRRMLRSIRKELGEDPGFEEIVTLARGELDEQAFEDLRKKLSSWIYRRSGRWS